MFNVLIYSSGALIKSARYNTFSSNGMTGSILRD